ncbi:uncharacterized protein LOC130826155 [Amaranthus tricolor]|uniref:uncharacterized protein LOC130826155 n=1 Tax=Amaranthus tricolor TaxID=29722 RepID=UPI002589A375|nr:uncharacterized protein LOC130826155 [Amaranthus tricolor]
MSIARLTRTQALESSKRLYPFVDNHVSRICSNNSWHALFGSLNSTTRDISTYSSPILFQHTTASSGISNSFLKFSPQFSIVRKYTSSRLFDPYERYMRRTAINWGVIFVPQQEAYVIERFGKFSRVLGGGVHLLVPLVDRIAYIHSLKEQTIEIPEQTAVTTDNVAIRVNAVLFVKIIDPEKASYGNDNVMFAVTQFAQLAMRSAIGKMQLDKTFMERDNLNANITQAINDVASGWGLVCGRYEIRDIIPPRGVSESMEMQAEAERKKRAAIIEAEGTKEASIISSNADKRASIYRAEGDAEAIRIIAETLKGNGGQEAASLKLAQDYVQAFNNMAKESTTIVLPASLDDGSKLVATALGLYKNVIVKNNKMGMPSELSNQASSTGQVEHGVAYDSEDKPVFSLQRTKETL